MSDSINGQEMTDEQTVEPMPSSEQPAEAPQEPALPDGVKERTADEFEKLKAANKALKEQLEASKGPRPTSVLDELRPRTDTVPQVTVPVAGQQQVQAPQEQVFDDAGYVDTVLLNKKLSEAERRANQAQEQAKQASLTVENMQRFQEGETVRKVHEKFPEVDPNNVDSFNPEFYHKVKLELLNQATTTGTQNFEAAAATVKKLYYSQSVAQPVADKKVISSREQASVTTGASKGPQAPIDQDALVNGTRKGDADAIYKRLQASGY